MPLIFLFLVLVLKQRAQRAGRWVEQWLIFLRKYYCLFLFIFLLLPFIRLVVGCPDNKDLGNDGWIWVLFLLIYLFFWWGTIWIFLLNLFTFLSWLPPVLLEVLSTWYVLLLSKPWILLYFYSGYLARSFLCLLLSERIRGNPHLLQLNWIERSIHGEIDSSAEMAEMADLNDWFCDLFARLVFPAAGDKIIMIIFLKFDIFERHSCFLYYHEPMWCEIYLKFLQH